jgi:hypothetical protein
LEAFAVNEVDALHWIKYARREIGEAIHNELVTRDREVWATIWPRGRAATAALLR